MVNGAGEDWEVRQTAFVFLERFHNTVVTYQTNVVATGT